MATTRVLATHVCVDNGPQSLPTPSASAVIVSVVVIAVSMLMFAPIWIETSTLHAIEASSFSSARAAP